MNLRGEEEVERFRKRSTKTSLNTMTPASDHRPCKINNPVCSQTLFNDSEGAKGEVATEADESFHLHGETESPTDKLQHELNLARKGITLLE